MPSLTRHEKPRVRCTTTGKRPVYAAPCTLGIARHTTWERLVESCEGASRALREPYTNDAGYCFK